jgi:peptide/nickel transport system ATP-binding protein
MVEVGGAKQILEAPKTAYATALVNERRAATHNPLIEPPAGAEPLLNVTNVEAGYRPGTTVVRGISFQLARGETLAVVGESGSGKSSLARVVAGLLPRRTGDVQLAGVSLSAAMASRPREVLRRMQMVHQMPDTALNPRQTLGEIIGRPMTLFFDRSGPQVKDRVAKLLTQVGLPADFAQRRPGQLSGGQKQRVCIARALAAEPDLIICDEPTSALDPLVAEDVLKLLRQLQEDMGLAYMFITHDLGTVRRIAHRTAVMLKGEIIAQGPTAQIFAPPYHPYTEKLISSVPEMDTTWLDDVLARRPAA